jgi:hypothetical protein
MAGALGGGLAVTGNYPGKARTPDELRGDLDAALAVIPGKAPAQPARLLRGVRRQEGRPRSDRRGALRQAGSPGPRRAAWGSTSIPPASAHPKAADGFTLSHADRGIRKFWIEHCRRSREIGAAMGKALGTPCVTNVWVPDGFKDTPADRLAAAGAARRFARRGVRENALPAKAQPRRGRAEALRDRQRELHGGVERVLPRLLHHAEEAALPRRGPLPSHREHLRQDLERAHLPARDPAAREPRRPLGLRPRGDAHRRPAGDRPRDRGHAATPPGCTSASTTSTPASTGSPPGRSARGTCCKALLVALLEPPSDPQGREGGRLHGPARAPGRGQGAAGWAAVWDHYCQSRRTCPSARPGSTTCESTRRSVTGRRT